MSRPLAARTAAPPRQPADSLSDRHFDRIATIVHEHTGICLPPTKRIMLEARLRKRTRERGLPSLAAYCADLFDHGGLAQELTHLIDLATTNKTDFFREPEHYRFLAGPGLDQIFALHGGAESPRFTFWCAACSNGAEVYTMAMVLADQAATRREKFDFSILGTDICTSSIAEARRAIYPASFVAAVPPHMRRRYFLEARDPDRRDVRIAPEIRRTTRFAHRNLMENDPEIPGDLDGIFLRNVLIYFEHDVQIAVARRVFRHLRPGGFLFLGHSETSVASALPVTAHGPAVFQKT